MTEPTAAAPDPTPATPPPAPPPAGPIDPAAKARRDNWLWATLLVILTLIVYQPAVHGTFLWDDPRYVMVGDNAPLRSLHGLFNIWFHPSTGTTRDTFTTIQYYPLTFTLFWIQYHLWGLSPVGYHLVNVVLHAGSALILWQLLKLLRVPGAWLAAAIFAVHPIEVESVAWITELKNVLSCTCFLASIYAYLRYAGASYVTTNETNAPTSTTSKPAWHWYAVSLLLFAGAVFAKSVTSLTPVVIALLLFWRVRPAFNVRTLAGLIPFLILGALLGRETAWMEQHIVGAAGPDWDHAFTQRLLIAGHAFWFYPAKLLWPLNLIFTYPRWDPSDTSQWVYVIAAAVAIVAAAAMLLVRPVRGIGVAILAYAVLVFPAMGFFNVYPMRYSFVADHFQYHAGIAVIALVVGLLAALLWRGDRAPGAQALQAAAGLVVFILAILTWRQSSIYAGPVPLWRDTLAKNPDAWMAHDNLGLELIRAAAEQQAAGDADGAKNSLNEAVEHFERATSLRPNHAMAYDKWGVALRDLRRYPEAADKFAKAIELDPTRDEPHLDLGLLYMQTNRPADARAEFDKAVAINPRNWQAYLYSAQIVAAAGQFPDAERLYRRAEAIHPNNADVQFGLALVLDSQKKYRDALPHAVRAAELDPDSARVQTVLGLLYGSNGYPRESFAAFKRALEIDPNNKGAIEGARALINATAEMRRAATRAATRAAATRSTTRPQLSTHPATRP